MKTDLPSDYRQLQLALSHIGFFRRGTLLKRMMTCGKPVCACKASPPRLHGPYYQWTRKVDGKTVTVNLSAQQAKLLEGGSLPARNLIASSPKWSAFRWRQPSASCKSCRHQRARRRSGVAVPSGVQQASNYPTSCSYPDAEGRGGAGAQY